MKQTKLFKQDVAIQAILYVLQKMGGICDIHRCHKILYFADNEHLSKYGRTITGGVISVRDRLTEMGDTDEYIKYIEEQMRAEEAVA